MQYEQERAALIAAGLELSQHGLNVGTSGNMSVRIDDLVLITPSGVDYEVVQPEDMAVLTLDGTVVARTVAPSSELELHCAIYRSSRAGAIVHTHSKFAVAVGTLVDEVPPIHYIVEQIGGAPRVAPYETFGTTKLAERAVEGLEDRKTVLLRNHGAVAWGGDLTKALSNAIKLEWLCEVYWHARVAGDPAILTDDQLAAYQAQARTMRYR